MKAEGPDIGTDVEGYRVWELPGFHMIAGLVQPMKSDEKRLN